MDEIKLAFSRDITVYSWENIWEEGNGDKAYKLANAGYKVIVTKHKSWLPLVTRYGDIAYKLANTEYKVMVTKHISWLTLATR